MVAGFHILSLLSSAAGGPVFFVPGDEASAKAQSPLLNLALWGQDGLRVLRPPALLGLPTRSLGFPGRGSLAQNKTSSAHWDLGDQEGFNFPSSGELSFKPDSQQLFPEA